MHKRNIVLLCLITFLQGMVFYAAVATLYRQAAGLSIFEITAIEGISVAMALALEVPWGRIAERIGYRHTMVVCNLLFLLTKLIFWQAESFSAFLLERLLLAVVISGLSGVDAAMLFMSAPKEQAQRNGGWYRAAGEAGVLSAGLLYTVFLSGHYRAAAFWTVITYALAALLTFFLSEVKSEEQRETRRFRALAKAHFSTPGILKLAVCAALFSESVHCITIYFSQLRRCFYHCFRCWLIRSTVSTSAPALRAVAPAECRNMCWTFSSYGYSNTFRCADRAAFRVLRTVHAAGRRT